MNKSNYLVELIETEKLLDTLQGTMHLYQEAFAWLETQEWFMQNRHKMTQWLKENHAEHIPTPVSLLKDTEISPHTLGEVVIVTCSVRDCENSVTRLKKGFRGKATCFMCARKRKNKSAHNSYRSKYNL